MVFVLGGLRPEPVYLFNVLSYVGVGVPKTFQRSLWSRSLLGGSIVLNDVFSEILVFEGRGIQRRVSE